VLAISRHREELAASKSVPRKIAPNLPGAGEHPRWAAKSKISGHCSKPCEADGRCVLGRLQLLNQFALAGDAIEIADQQDESAS